jgi:hypothetical protein
MGRLNDILKAQLEEAWLHGHEVDAFLDGIRDRFLGETPREIK